MGSMLTQTSVLNRWSKGVLAQLLGEPDLRKKVRGRTNLGVLYLESRVVAAENSEVFKSLQVSLASRKSSAAKAILTKTNQLLAAVEARPRAKSEENANRPEEDASKTIFGRR